MKRTFISISILAASALSATAALAHEPAAVDGGLSAWMVHQLTQPDHLIAFGAAVVLGAGFYAYKKARAVNPLD